MIATVSTRHRPLKILPVGDSITAAAGVTGGWRYYLEDLLVAKDFAPSWMGFCRNNARPSDNHEGWGSYTTADMRTNFPGVSSWYDTWNWSPPDIVIIGLGTNDVLDTSGSEAAMNGLLDDADGILDRWPGVSLLFSGPPDRFTGGGSPEYTTEIAALRGYWTKISGERAATGSRSAHVTQSGVIAFADTSDGVHPNASGYSKMADAMINTMLTVIP